MRKLAVILLLSIFILNLIGYKIVYHYSLQQSDQKFISNLDQKKYNDKDLFIVKIPLQNAYQNESDFERFDGEIELKGVIYKYVKRKISDGNLILLCLRDGNKMRIESAKNNLAKSESEALNTSSRKANKALVQKSVLNDFELTENNLSHYQIKNSSSLCFPLFIEALVFHPNKTPAIPPDVS